MYKTNKLFSIIFGYGGQDKIKYKKFILMYYCQTYIFLKIMRY